jgi:choline dehydrogenase-like flavoprotein
VLIVGSGYGGAVAADRLARWRRPDGEPLRIVLLERGLEYLSGAFPSTFAELPGHVRFCVGAAEDPRGQFEGLFDMRLGADMSVLLANGVGGGSLINAGVMEIPRPEVFGDPAWPAPFDHDLVSRRAKELRVELGAAFSTERINGVDTAGYGEALDRRARMRELGAGETREAPITVALRAQQLSCAQVKLNKCIGCGDCATGCNHGAKISLDVSLLHRAAERGVRIVSGATVTRVKRAGSGWELEVWHTDLGRRRRMGDAIALRAPRVILAAGALGSSEILLRSQEQHLRFSEQLGRRFSGNGDIIAAIVGAKGRMNASAEEDADPAARGVGPTITSMVDWREHPAGTGAMVQDLAVPAPLRRLLEEVIVTTDTLASLAEPDRRAHDPEDDAPDPCAIDPARIEHSTVLAVMVRDEAAGRLTLVERAAPASGHMDSGLTIDAGVQIHWPAARDDPRVAQAHRRIATEVERRLEGTLRANPLWRPLPERLAVAFDAGNGPMITVHPLGGCPMGNDRGSGAVNACGEVFDADPLNANASAVHEGLVVLDGAVIPTSLGINPALTIATVADLAIEGLREKWGLLPPDPSHQTQAEPAVTPVERPPFKHGAPRAPRRPTQIELVERMAGWVQLDGKERWVELSGVFRPGAGFDVAARGATLAGMRLRVQPDPAAVTDGADPSRRMSVLRIYDRPPLRYLPPDSPANAAKLLLEVPVMGGEQRFFHREASIAFVRRLAGFTAFLFNRGVRDGVQMIGKLLSTSSAPSTKPAGAMASQALSLLGLAWDLGTRAAQVRLVDYDLELGTAIGEPNPEFASWKVRPGTPRRLMGRKRLTYSRRANPWRQFMRLTLSDLGSLPLGAKRVIEVQPSYFAQMRLPLVRIVGQENQPQALADVGSLLAYVARVLFTTHFFSLREPDAPYVRTPQRLPGPLPTLPPPEVHEIAPEPGAHGVIRLTRYRRDGDKHPRAPVLMVHGYSASGTTFAHPAIRPDCLASFLHGQGVDAWVVDLRSSSGLPTGADPWTFDQLARHDVTAAIRFVHQAAGGRTLDIVSHCMGSAVVAMALLDEGNTVRPLVRRWVLSQVGPAMVMSPANMLRAHLMRYLLGAMPRLRYGIGSDEGLPGMGGGVLDRLLATLPYLGEGAGCEFDIENPLIGKRPWVRTRHRLDALVGRVFDARRMTKPVLEHIDDFFGEVNLQTLSQTVHFAEANFVTDPYGRNWVYERNVHKRLADLPMLSLHGCDNGLADLETQAMMRERLDVPDAMLEQKVYPSRGHQDLLIGENPLPVFRDIDEFLGRADAPGAKEGAA